MSHVDEETLTAYLDGAWGPEDPEHQRIDAHLAGCAECRELLEQERAVRERAAHVLGMASPADVRAPGFEQILAMRAARGDDANATIGTTASANADTGANHTVTAGSGDAAGQRTGRRFRMPLTLAATALLAVTAVTFARLYLPSRNADSASPMMMDQVQEEKQASTATGDEAQGPQRRALATPPAPTVSSPGTPPQAAANEAVSGQREERERAAAAAPPTDIRRSSEESRRFAQQMVREQDTAGAAGAGAAQPLAEAAIVTGPPDSTEQQIVRAAELAAWRDVSPQEADRLLGSPPATLPGIRVDTMQATTVLDRNVVRTVQRLDAANTVEITQWSGVQPAEAPSLQELVVTGGAAARQARAADRNDMAAKSRDEAAGFAVTAARVEALRVVLKARVSADSLSALARSLRH